MEGLRCLPSPFFPLPSARQLLRDFQPCLHFIGRRAVSEKPSDLQGQEENENQDPAFSLWVTVFFHSAMFIKFQRNFGMVLTKFNFSLSIFVQALYFIHVKAHKVLGLGIVCFIHSPIQPIAIEQLLWTRHSRCWWCTNKTGWSPVLWSCYASCAGLWEQHPDKAITVIWVWRDRAGKVPAGTKVPVPGGEWLGTMKSHITQGFEDHSKNSGFFFFFWVYYKLLKAFSRRVTWSDVYLIKFTLKGELDLDCIIINESNSNS